MIGMKSTTWAISKKLGGWQTLAYTPMETNYEYVSAGSWRSPRPASWRAGAKGRT